MVPSVKALAEVDGVLTVLTAGQSLGAVRVLNVGGGCVTLTRAAPVKEPSSGGKQGRDSKHQIPAAPVTRTVCYTPAPQQPMATTNPGQVTVPSPLAGLPPGTPITTGGPLPR